MRQVAEGVVSRRCAKASKRRLGESIKCRILARVRATPPGFWSDTGSGLLARRRVQIAEETLCGWLIEGWLWHVAKGRAEGLFQALQDRPVKALRLSDVGDLAAANAFLPKDLAGHNARFAVMSENEADAHVACAGEVNGRARSRTLHHRRDSPRIWCCRSIGSVTSSRRAVNRAMRYADKP